MAVNAYTSKHLKSLSVSWEANDEIVRLEYSSIDHKWSVALFDYKDHVLKQRFRANFNTEEEACELFNELTHCDEGVIIEPEVGSYDALHRTDSNLDGSVLLSETKE